PQSGAEQSRPASFSRDVTPSPVPVVRRSLLAEARGTLAPVLGRRGERAGDGLEGDGAFLALGGVDELLRQLHRDRRPGGDGASDVLGTVEPTPGRAHFVRKAKPESRLGGDRLAEKGE